MESGGLRINDGLAVQTCGADGGSLVARRVESGGGGQKLEALVRARR